jgi:methionyl aminopeptidase
VTSYAARIPVKSRREIEQMREAACHVAEILLELRERALPGVTTGELDEYAEASISRRGVRSSFKGYDPDGLPRYPAVLCVSVNDEIVHGIPGSRELVDSECRSTAITGTPPSRCPWGTSGRRKGACSTCRAGRSTKPWR